MAEEARDARATAPARPGAADACAGVLADPVPTQEELRFARATYIVLRLWPALNQAVLEQWGGPESNEKRAFLLSHLCDEYGSGKGSAPDVDDLADLLDNYVAEEYDCQLEDDSAMWVALHIHNAYEAVFVQNRGEALLQELEAAFAKTGKDKPRAPAAAAAHKAPADVGHPDHDDSDAEDAGADADADGAHDARLAASHAPQRAPRPAPAVDDEGFATVVPRRRR